MPLYRITGTNYKNETIVYDKAYDWERATWPKFCEIKIDRKQAGKYVKKLVRHFKTKPVEIDYDGWDRSGGQYFGWERMIKLPKETNLGTVIHEFAHHLTRGKFGAGMHHNRKFKKTLKRVYRYAERWLKT